MIDPSLHQLVFAFLLLCRLGALVMVMPGTSSPRLPMQVRLAVAMAATVALAPLLLPGIAASIGTPTVERVLALIVSETAIGILIGLMARIFFLALEFAGSAIATYAGYGGIPGVPIDDHEALSPIATLLTLTAIVAAFSANLHIELLRGLVASYGVVPVGTAPLDAVPVQRLIQVLGDAFSLTLQLSAPLLVFSLLLNVLFGLAGKMVANIPVYFVSVPFALAGGLVMLLLTGTEMVGRFIAAFEGWLARG